MRIITGSARGCRLKTPPGLGTRPTADRTREALFSILGGRVVNAEVLDLFAGTGALGLEALSRGAASAILVDHATQAILQENVRRTHMEEHAVIRRSNVFNTLSALAREGRIFDLIFADPPYAQGNNARVLTAVEKGKLLAPEGLLVLEQSADEPLLQGLDRISLLRERRYGAARICLYAWQEVQE